MQRAANTVGTGFTHLQLGHPLLQAFSTSFTAPGYDHSWAEQHFTGAHTALKTGALHDIHLPDAWLPKDWGESDESYSGRVEQHKKTRSDALDKVRAEVGDHTLDDYGAQQQWHSGIRRALTKGHINIDEAEKRGFRGDGRESGEKYTDDDYKPKRRGGWQPLPPKVYHVSTDADAIQRDGLKSRRELGGVGTGLGGGHGMDQVSVTADHALGPDIYHALHEHHAFLNGKISPDQLLDYAKHPPVGKPFHEELGHTISRDVIDQARTGIEHHQGTVLSEWDQKKTGWQPSAHYPADHPLAGQPTSWHRQMTPEEHLRVKSEFYKGFSHTRGSHFGGQGHRDPLFLSNDPVAFAKSNPEHFGIVHLKSHPGAQGFPLDGGSGKVHSGADSGEWRTGEGSPFDVEKVEKPTPRHLGEFGLGHKEAAFEDHVDPDARTKGPGEEWRTALPPEHDEVLRKWERVRGGAELDANDRKTFRKLVSSAPPVDGPVYRGAPNLSASRAGFGPLVKKHEPGTVVNFPRHSSTSTREHIASGFSHVVYEIHGANARGIGNTLHEAVMPPGKYQVHSAEMHRDAPSRSMFDGKTVYPSTHLHVVLHPAPIEKQASLPPRLYKGVSARALGEIQAHGGLKPSEMGESGPGVYLTNDHEYAKRYAGMGYGGGAILHVEHLVTNPLVRNLDDKDDPGERKYRNIQQMTPGGSINTDGALGRALHEAGHDAVETTWRGRHEVAVHDPSKLRIVHVEHVDGEGNPRTAATQLVHPSRVWDHIRTDVKPHTLDHLRRQIDAYGYHADWDLTDGPIKVDLSGEKPVVSNGSHRLHVLKERGMDDPIPMQVSGALNEPGSLPELIRHHEGTQTLYQHADGAGRPLCAAHAVMDEGWQRKMHEFGRQVGLTEGEAPERPSMRAVGRGRCMDCAADQTNARRYDPQPQQFEKNRNRPGSAFHPEPNHWGDHSTTAPFTGLPHSLNAAQTTMPLDELRKLKSEDYGVTVDKVRPKMMREWRGPDTQRTTWREHGGPGGYVDHLSGQIAEHGITEPIEIGHRPDGSATIYDGTHRALIAHEQGIDPVPVAHFQMVRGQHYGMRRRAVQAPPEGLTFDHREEQTGGSKYPTLAHLDAVHPEHGRVGTLRYYPPKRRNGQILVDNLHVEPEHRRQGIGSALMDEMQRRHPDSSINHGDRTNDGKAWWSGYTQNLGRPVVRGRTATQRIAAEDYWMNHRPGGGPGSDDEEEGTAAPAHALDKVYPADVYTHPHYYGTGEGLHGGPKAFRETVNTLRKIRGNPEAPVTMYRSLPPEHAHKGFRPGDWTSVHPAYAEGHGLHNEDEKKDWPVIKATVPAKHLWNNGDSLDEFGYHGPPIAGEVHSYGGSESAAIVRQHKQAGAAGPDYADTSFSHEEQGVHGIIRAHAPDGAIRGALMHRAHPAGSHYGTDEPYREVEMLHVEPDHRRRGVASQLMGELERTHPGEVIEHDRSDDGRAWAKSYFGNDQYEDLTRDGNSILHTGSMQSTAAASGFTEANHFAERIDKGPDDEPYLNSDEFKARNSHRDYTAPGGQQYRLLHNAPGTGSDTITAHQRLSNGKYRGVGYLSWFGGKNDPDRENDGSNINGGKIYKVQVSPQHRRRGLASAMLDFGRVHRPDLRHSNALSDDGRAWAEKVGSKRCPCGQRVEWDESNGWQHADGSIGHGRDGFEDFSVSDLVGTTPPKTASMQARDFEGDVGNPNHITRNESGHLPIDAVTHMRGARGEIPGEHRNRRGADWEAFKADVAANGIKEPIFITVDHGKEPVLSEGSHRRDAAVELGHTHIPAEVRYYGHAEQEGTVEQRGHRTAARFTPRMRVFGPTCGLDHRLWDAEEKLRPEVRAYILQSITRMWGGRYADWGAWARVYFAGSEASEWTSDSLEGNNDFDVLVGVNYRLFRQHNPAYRHASSQAITDEMNHGFRAFNGPVTLTIDGVQYGPFDRTTYVNPNSYDIRDIKPYAAYDVGEDRWVVKPPHLPHWDISDLHPAVVRALRSADAYAHSVLKLPEPERTQQAAALFDAWHSDRSRAFGPRGEGWWDIANLREKWLDQEGTWAELVDAKHRWDRGEGMAPANWSNDPLMPRTAALYHWAPKDARDDIAAHGLDHTRAPSYDPKGHGPHGIFMHHDRATAKDWVPDIERTHDLYEVDTHGLALRPDPYDTGDASYSPQAIAPGRLRRVEASKWEDRLPKTETCKYCSQQATQRILHAEGMAYVPVCDRHVDKAVQDVGPDEVVGQPRPIKKQTARRNPHHGEGPWFHGTNADLKPGDQLLPGDQVGEKSHGHFSDGTKVWVSNDPWRASAYGHRTFAVEPHSRPRSPYANHDEHHTLGATILHEVDREGNPIAG